MSLSLWPGIHVYIMHGWSDTSPRGASHGGRGGEPRGATFEPGRRVWRNGGGPGYAGETVSSAARLTKSVSTGDEGTRSTLWGNRWDPETAVRGYWATGRGRGAPPRGRGGISQGSETHTRALAHDRSTSTATDTGASAPTTYEERSEMQHSGPGRRGGYNTSPARGTRGVFGSTRGFTGHGGSAVHQNFRNLLNVLKWPFKDG